MVNPASVIALAAAAVNLSMATLHFAIARAPGWRIARLSAAMALTAGCYNLLNVAYCIQGLPDAVYLAAGRLSYLVGTVQAVLWLVYAYSDANGSLSAEHRPVRWVSFSALAIGSIFAATGWLIAERVSPVSIPWAGVTYSYPLNTEAGEIYGLVLMALPLAAIIHLVRRLRRGERTLGWQLGLFAVVLLFALEEVLVANRTLNFPSLLDIGLLLLVVPFSWQVVDRVVNDARKLRNLSDHLESEVLRRTDERDQVRSALVKAESAISDLVASLDAIVWEADAPTLQPTFVSEGAGRLLGYSIDQWDPQPGSWHRYVHPDDRERVLASTREAGLSGSKVSLEYRMLAADGRIRWFRNYVHPLGNSTANPNRLRGIIVDVTESRHAQEALLESEERFRSLFENATVGIYRTTPDGRLLMANPALIGLLGYTSFEELASRSRAKDGFERSYPRSDFRRQMESQGTITGLEVAWTRRDGTEVFVRESAKAVRAEEGSTLYYDGIVEDFTQRKRAEEALHESEGRFRSVADTCPVIIWYGGPDRKVTFLNKHAASFTGRALEELLQDGWIEQVHPDDWARLDTTLASAVSQHQSFQTEFRLRRHDGEYRWVVDTAVPRFVGSVFSGHTGIIVDITELKRNQEQSLATQKLESLGVLASGIAHDFNNMLGGILAQSELALLDVPADSPVAEGVMSIRTISLRAAEIVSQLLAYAGEESTRLEPVDLSPLVGEMLELLGVSISKQSALKTDLAERLPAVRASAPQIRQIVMNLVTNASEALGESGGEIFVTTGLVRGDLPGGDRVVLKVRDTGCGMSEEIQARIFDPFFTTRFAGRGLGLASVQGIVRSHGGEIKVVSAPGKGTCFEISLPCAREQTGGNADVPGPGITGQGEPVLGTILLVEDEEALRLPASKMLRRSGLAVLEAGDGEAALDLFRANNAGISAILLDLTLPGTAGSEVLAEVLRIRPDTKVILTTAYSEEVAVRAVGGQRHSAFIRKPYTIADLVKLIQEVLST